MEVKQNSSSSQSKLKNIKQDTGNHRLMGVEDLVTSQGIDKSSAENYGTKNDVEAILNGGNNNSQIFSTTQSNSNIKDLSSSASKHKPSQYYDRSGDQFHSGEISGKYSHKSILKSSRCNQDEQLASGIRLDSHGSPIKRRVSQEDKPLHKITFGNKIEEVNIVENWKAYNVDASQEPTCGCSVF